MDDFADTTSGQSELGLYPADATCPISSKSERHTHSDSITASHRASPNVI